MPDIEVYSKDAQIGFAIDMIKANAARQVTFTIGRKDIWANKSILQADYPPFIDHNRSYLPLRLLAQAMGYMVEWDDASFTATLRRGQESIEVPLRKNVFYINGDPVYLEDPILLRENRSFVPVRAVAEALGCDVYWNNDARQVTVRW
ncbi:MAG TPA: copper amine oxidase N-terminal domain-containing protein [Firmicutes bacterium]|nr:copper amine oxidase N-terminal domain-containing protein [Bacillota bacterium]